MIIGNERELMLDIQNYFNEEDYSVGVNPIYTIDKDVINEFTEVFENIEVISYNKDEIEFSIGSGTYVVTYSTSYERWEVYKKIYLAKGEVI